MPALTTALRRALVLLMLSAFIGAAVTYRRQRSSAGAPSEPPVWPEFPDLHVVPPPATEPAVAADAGSADDRSTDDRSTWLPATVDGSIPVGYPVKVKESSGIFHVPGGRFYERTNADRHYASAEAAEADGYRRSKS